MYNNIVVNTEESLIRKYTSKVKQYEDGISLAIGEPFCEVNKNIIRKTKESLDNKETKYTNAQGDTKLIEAICKKENVNNDEVLVTLGSSEGIFITLLSILNPEDEVIIITPCYPQYTPVVQFCCAKVKYVDTLKTNNVPTKEEIQKVITNKTKAIIINSPANPTGKSYDKETLEIINHLSIKHNFFIICDDVYECLTYKKIEKFEKENSKIIKLKSFSKTYGMTGFRLGYIIADKMTIKEILKVHSYLAISVPVFIQKAGVEALKITEFNNHFLQENLKIIIDFLDRNNLSYISVDGGIFIFINIKKTNKTSIQFCDELLDEFHVACVPGNCFLAPDYIRINFGVKKEELLESLSRIQQYINQLKKGL